MRRGEIRWYTFHPPDKRRPVLILTRNGVLPYLTSVTVAPLTTTMRDLPSHVLLTPDQDGVQQTCVVNLDNIQTVERTGVGTLIAQLSPLRMQDIDAGLVFALGIDTGSSYWNGH